MLHALVNTLIKKISEEFKSLEVCQYYKGELEEGGEWNPVFPAVFINVSQMKNTAITSSRHIAAMSAKINVYLAIKYEEEQPSLLADLIIFLNSLNFSADINLNYKFNDQNIYLHGYFYSITVFRIELEVEAFFN